MFAWAQDDLDRPIASVEPVRGGLTNTISAIALADGDPIILRHVRSTAGVRSDATTCCRQALGCPLLAASGLPIPRLIASDPNGSRGRDYVNLTTCCPVGTLDALGPTRSRSWPRPR